MMPILQTEEITYTYPNGPVALSGVSIDMAPGSDRKSTRLNSSH